MKKMFWVIIAGGVVMTLLVMTMIVSAVSGSIAGASFSFAGFGSLSLWLAVAMIALWAYLKHKKSGLTRTAGWIAVALLLFAWFGPARTTQIAQGTGVALDSAANTVTNLVTTGSIKSPTQIAAERKAEVEAEKQRMINAAIAQAAAEAEAAKYRPLTKDAFTTRTAGKFEPIQIRSGTRIGPIYAYAACELRWTKTGMGMIKIYTRPDSTSKPVEATLTDRGYGIKKPGHEGLVSDLFFEAVQGDIQIELVRLDNGTDKKNPCE